MEETVSGVVLTAAARVGLTKVLDNAFKNAKYGVLSRVRSKLYMEEARQAAIDGLQENLKAEVKVWSGFEWEADKCPVVSLGKGIITNQEDIEALAASSVSIEHQAIMDAGNEELRGQKGFSFIVMSRLRESSVLTRRKDALRILRDNITDCTHYRIKTELKRSVKLIKKPYAMNVQYAPQEHLIANEVADALLHITADRGYKLNQSMQFASNGRASTIKGDDDLDETNEEEFREEVNKKLAAKLKELGFASRMEAMAQAMKLNRPLAPNTINNKNVQPSRTRHASSKSHELKKKQIQFESKEAFSCALASVVSEEGMVITSEGISRIIQSELAVSDNKRYGPVRLCVANEDSAWEFKGISSEEDMEVLNLAADKFKRKAKGCWYLRHEGAAVAFACAVAACLSCCFCLTYEDRIDPEKFRRMHVYINKLGDIECLVEQSQNECKVFIRQDRSSDEVLGESEEEIYLEFTERSRETSMNYGLTRSWCAISEATAKRGIQLYSVASALTKEQRRDLAAFLLKFASGEAPRVQRDGYNDELYYDVESGIRSTNCKWLDELIRKWATSKRSTRIRVALTVKREEVAASLDVKVEAKAPETDLDKISERMRDLRLKLIEKVRKHKLIMERGQIVALRNSYKEREFSTMNRFRRYTKNNFVVHVSTRNVIVVQRRGESRYATWLPCDPEGYRANYLPHRLGELSDKAALALVVFGRRMHIIDDVELYDLEHSENGDSNLERALTTIVKKGTELCTCSSDFARKVIEVGNEQIKLNMNDNDMIRRFIMVTAFAEGVGMVKSGATWTNLIQDPRHLRADASFEIDSGIPSVMLHGNTNWMVAGNWAYRSLPKAQNVHSTQRTARDSRNSAEAKGDRAHGKKCEGNSSVDNDGINSKRMNLTRVIDASRSKIAGELGESFWPGGLVIT